ncbi:MAG: hypothetical protein V1800_16710 [Candidatus Latescibacterota bacterium]
MHRLGLLFALAVFAVTVPGVAVKAETASGQPNNSRNDLGFSLGTPAALNLEWEHVTGSGTLALSGMYFGDTHGLQVGYAPSRLRSSTNPLRLQVIAGTLQMAPEGADLTKWTYVGAEGVWRPGRFLLAIGLTVGSGTDSSPQLTARIGLVWPL